MTGSMPNFLETTALAEVFLEEELRMIATAATVEAVAPGQVIAMEGEVPRDFLMPMKGFFFTVNRGEGTEFAGPSIPLGSILEPVAAALAKGYSRTVMGAEKGEILR